MRNSNFGIKAHKLLRLYGSGLKPGKSTIVKVDPAEFFDGEIDVTKVPRGPAGYTDLPRYMVKVTAGIATITRVK